MEEQKVNPGVDQVSLLDYAIFLMKWKKLIVQITAACFVAAVIISLLLPKKFLGETKILLPQQPTQSMSAQMLSQLSMSILAGDGTGGMRTTGDLYSSLLKSRAILDRVIDRFDLMKVYGEDLREDARDDLMEALSITDMKKSGTLVIGVEDTDPTRSAAMANAFIEELKNLTQRIAVTEASQRRLFFEEQLMNTKKTLVHAEESMKGYQEQTGALEIKDQTKVVIESIANLRAQMAAKEVERKVLKASVTPQNPDLQRVEEQLQGMREQVLKLEAKGGNSADPFLSTGRMPQAGTGYMRKLRDLKYSETLYELLVKQYEMAKMDEAKEAMVIQVVDKAIAPEEKIKPRRVFIVLGYTLIGFCLALFTAIFMEYRERVANDPVKRVRVERLKAYAAQSMIRQGRCREQE